MSGNNNAHFLSERVPDLLADLIGYRWNGLAAFFLAYSFLLNFASAFEIAPSATARIENRLPNLFLRLIAASTWSIS